jgi:hypothetical protein
VNCCNETAGAVYDRRARTCQHRGRRLDGGKIHLALMVGVVLCTGGAAASARAGEGIAWWNTPRKGANCQNARMDAAYWQAAGAAGIEFVRLVPDGWKGTGRDFLLGDADQFEAIPEADALVLRRVLDDAHAAGVHVVLTMFSLPGARWKQNNSDKDDARLWQEPGFQEQAATFWRTLAARFHDHPALAGYDPLNEPHPERAFGFDDPADPKYPEWHASAAAKRMP